MTRPGIIWLRIEPRLELADKSFICPLQSAARLEACRQSGFIIGIKGKGARHSICSGIDCGHGVRYPVLGNPRVRVGCQKQSGATLLFQKACGGFHRVTPSTTGTGISQGQRRVHDRQPKLQTVALRQCHCNLRGRIIGIVDEQQNIERGQGRAARTTLIRKRQQARRDTLSFILYRYRDSDIPRSPIHY